MQQTTQPVPPAAARPPAGLQRARRPPAEVALLDFQPADRRSPASSTYYSTTNLSSAGMAWHAAASVAKQQAAARARSCRRPHRGSCPGHCGQHTGHIYGGRRSRAQPGNADSVGRAPVAARIDSRGHCRVPCVHAATLQAELAKTPALDVDDEVCGKSVPLFRPISKYGRQRHLSTQSLPVSLCGLQPVTFQTWDRTDDDSCENKDF